ncbi:MAG: HPr family phosphocarrier protein [Clostridiales bacterium]|nr:HPr family phosphocarrier protein [Clostridiales bacterium]
MTELKIKLLTISDVKDFVAAATAQDYDIDLISGRYTVDAKSLMGIFSIVPSESLELKIFSDDCGDFISKISAYVVE